MEDDTPQTHDATTNEGTNKQPTAATGDPKDGRTPAGGDFKGAMAGAAAEAAVDQAVGDRLSDGKKRLLAAGARGAAEGAMRGGAAGAGVGAAKETGLAALRQTSEGNKHSPTPEPDGRNHAGPTVDADNQDLRPKLGTGGTSYRRDQASGDEPEAAAGNGPGHPDSGGRNKKVALATAASAAPPAGLLALLILFLNWLKSFFFAMLAQALSFLQMMLQWVVGAGSALWNAATKPFMAAGAAVAKVVAAISGGSAVISTTVAAAGLAAVSGLGVLALIGGLLSVVSTTFTVHDDPIATDCSARGDSVVPVGSNEPVGTNADKNAQAVYSVLKTWGMPEVNIAGILGNWTQESGIDPTSVQNFPTGTYVMTDQKKSAALNTDNGIGLGQWTFGRNTLLRNYAGAKGSDWWKLGLQLRFMADLNGGDNPSDVRVFKGMLTTPQGTPAQAATYFHENWERSADGPAGIAARGQKAEMWFAKMSGWTVDKGLVRTTVGDFLNEGSTIVNLLLEGGHCNAPGNDGAVSPKSGGMTQEEAQALVDLFNQEGDKFLDGRYGEEGGPGSCRSNHAMNCTSFSIYFVNKYTTFQAYPPGDGIRTAYSIAEQTGKKMQSTPVPYSVGSGPGSTGWGHTLVVLGVDGDKVILGEAGYCAYMGRVRVDSAAAMAAEGWMFVDVSDLMLPADQVKKS